MSQRNFLVRLLLIFIHLLSVVHIFAAESSTTPLTQNELRMRYGQGRLDCFELKLIDD